MADLPTPTENLPAETEKEEDREERFIQLYCDSGNIRKAARDAGYSESYANHGIYQKFKNQKFLERLYTANKAMYATMLPFVQRARRNAINQLTDTQNWKEVAKNEKVLQSIEINSGSRSHDDFTPQPTVQIGSVQNLMLQIHQKPGDNDT